ncbi:hypothetical protein CVU76_02755, partial [Candidatus Dojkabacteria bacterium HGW-Dojkabacteria-1]
MKKLLKKVSKKSILIASILIVLIGVPVLAYLFTREQTEDTSAWYSTNWTFRRMVTLNGSGAPLTNEDVLITLDTQTLINAGKMQSDCGDLRFVDSDDSTLLNYWIEDDCNTNATKIWIRVPSLPAGGKMIYTYYGNPSVSNGTLSWSGYVNMYTDSSCPTGWTLNSSLQEKFALGSTTYGNTSGVSNHSHSNVIGASTSISTSSVGSSPAQLSGTGGSVSSWNGYTIHTFTSSGTLSLPTNVDSVEFLIVGGGGGGGQIGTAGNEGNGGGGAGGLLSSDNIGAVSLTAGNYSIVVGGGGSPNNKGGNSSALGYTAEGGGFGGYTSSTAGSGGSGGGGRGFSSTQQGGTGGSNVAYAGGGGGARDTSPGAGGSGGGGAGATGATGNGTSGTANRGGGGGGAGRNGGTAGSGGSGIVIVRYPTVNITATTTTHSHSNLQVKIENNDVLPRYRDMITCYRNSFNIPQNMISIFNETVPNGWTRFSELDNYFPRSNSTYGSTGGSATHTHVADPNESASVPYTSSTTANTLTGRSDNSMGGTITTVGSDRIHTFSSNGILLLPYNITSQFLIVGGGGGGGAGAAGNEGNGGGGAGGLITSNDTGTVARNAGSYIVAVGAGGRANNSGGNSSIFGYTATGGGFGGYTSSTAGSGGSGGGGRGFSSTQQGGTG